MLGFKIGFWDYATFAALNIIGAAIGGCVLLILGLPGKLEIARKHPEAEAVNLMAWANFFQENLKYVKPGQPAEVALNLYPVQIFTAKFEAIWKASDGGQMFPSGTLPDFEPPI